MTEARQPQPFNEAAALAELERLADRIQATRRQREQAVAEFDAFVRTFRPEFVRTGSSHASSIASGQPVVASSQPSVPKAHAPAQSPAPRSASEEFSAVEIFETPIPVNKLRSRRVEAVHQRPQGKLDGLMSKPSITYLAIAVVALALVLGGYFLVRSWRGQQSTATEPASVGVPTAGVAAPASAPAPSPTAGAAPRALSIELLTLRPVWLRVTTDGSRVLERELRADERLPFSADRTIVIRAGDAGAVRLTLNGRDVGPLGRNGWPTTRTLNAQQPTGR